MSKSFTTERSKSRALDRVELRVPEARVFGLLGPNGAGKSTMARVLLGLLGADEGLVVFRGQPVLDPALVRSQIAYLPQGGIPQTLWELRIDEMLRWHGCLRGLHGRRGRQAGDELLEEWELTHAARRTLGTLSGGERQLVSFLCALIGDRPGLILDEPSEGLDAPRRGALWRKVRRLADQGRTVVLITHNLAEAQLVLDDVAIIFEGRVRVQGDVQQLRSSWFSGSRLVVPPDTPRRALARLAALTTGREGGRDGGHTFLVPATRCAAVLETLSLLPPAVAGSISLTPPTIEDIYQQVTAGGADHA